MRTNATFTASVSAAIAFAVGCRDDGPDPAETSAAAPAQVTITATDYAFDAPDTITVLFCLVTAPDGEPHVAHGMIRQIRVV
ncbi:MAG: hypothetical protein L0271_04445 [Gemmatimonadetes bacterium]|nr:hypothetical protein [Gemmatimonadota bacterium]